MSQVGSGVGNLCSSRLVITGDGRKNSIKTFLDTDAPVHRLGADAYLGGRYVASEAYPDLLYFGFCELSYLGPACGLCVFSQVGLRLRTYLYCDQKDICFAVEAIL